MEELNLPAAAERGRDRELVLVPPLILLRDPSLHLIEIADGASGLSIDDTRAFNGSAERLSK